MMAKRVYEVWKGRNVFIFKGRMIFGPDAKSLIVTILLIVVPVAIFCSYVATNIVHEFRGKNAWYAVNVVAVLFTIYVLGLLFRTSSRDPGIVPRNSHPPEEELYYDSSTSVDVGGRQTPTPRMPRTKEVMVNGMPVKVKYCETCMLYRPPRCSHCSVCNNCVERFDHHCPWIGQCIGARNYVFFFMFVSSSTLLCMFVLVLSVLNLKFITGHHETVWKAMRASPASVALVAYCFIFLWFVGGLTCFHLYLISRNQTTYENFRYGATNTFNVYNLGCLRNFAEVLCTTTKPSKLKLRSFVQEEAPVPYVRHNREHVRHESDGNRRAKVEDNLEIDSDFLKISQRPNVHESDNIPTW